MLATETMSRHDHCQNLRVTSRNVSTASKGKNNDIMEQLQPGPKKDSEESLQLGKHYVTVERKRKKVDPKLSTQSALDREVPVVISEQDLIKDLAASLAKKTRDEIKMILR